MAGVDADAIGAKHRGDLRGGGAGAGTGWVVGGRLFGHLPTPVPAPTCAHTPPMQPPPPPLFAPPSPPLLAPPPPHTPLAWLLGCWWRCARSPPGPVGGACGGVGGGRWAREGGCARSAHPHPMHPTHPPNEPTDLRLPQAQDVDAVSLQHLPPLPSAVQDVALGDACERLLGACVGRMCGGASARASAWEGECVCRRVCLGKWLQVGVRGRRARARARGCPPPHTQPSHTASHTLASPHARQPPRSTRQPPSPPPPAHPLSPTHPARP